MTATAATIQDWINEAKADGATHMLVVTDTWDYTNYPVNIMPGRNPKDYKPGEGERIEECYALHLDIEEQMRERRCRHYEMPPC